MFIKRGYLKEKSGIPNWPAMKHEKRQHTFPDKKMIFSACIFPRFFLIYP